MSAAADDARLSRYLAVVSDSEAAWATRVWASRRAACLAERLGLITRSPSCEHCGGRDERLTRHHPDHRRALDVVWLCQRCHADHHKEEARQRRGKHASSRPERPRPGPAR